MLVLVVTGDGLEFLTGNIYLFTGIFLGEYIVDDIRVDHIIVDRKTREIMHMVASVRLSVFSRLNRLTYNLDFCQCVYNQGAYTDDSADAIDQLLIGF